MNKKNNEPFVKLRKLTEKSIIPYGKLKGMRVSDALAYRKTQIAWLYYHVEWLTFTEDVLDAALVFDDRRIQKPGIDDNAFVMYIASIKSKGRGVQNIIAENIKNKSHRVKAKRELGRAIAREQLSAGQLQAINHNKMKARDF